MFYSKKKKETKKGNKILKQKSTSQQEKEKNSFRPRSHGQWRATRSRKVNVTRNESPKTRRSLNEKHRHGPAQQEYLCGRGEDSTRNK